MAQTAGEEFTNAYRGAASAGNMFAGQRYKDERTALAPQQMQMRILQAKASIMNQRERLNMQQMQMQNQARRLDIQEQMLNTRVQQANNQLLTTYGQVPSLISPNGMSGGASSNGAPSSNPLASPTNPAGKYIFANPGLTQNQQIQMLYKNPVPYEMETTTGDLGQYIYPTQAVKSQLQNVSIAMPQLATSMNEIAKGAKYYGTAPDKLKKYFDSVGAYWMGNASPEQVKTLTDAGVSLNSITQAAETSLRVMGLPKTNEGLHQTLSMFMPQKGDTMQTYMAKQQNVFDEMKKRDLEAQYIATMGKPQNLAASQDMNNYVEAGMKNNFYGSMYEPSTSTTPMPVLTAPMPNRIGFYGDSSIVSRPATNSTLAPATAKATPAGQTQSAPAPQAPATTQPAVSDDQQNIDLIMQKYPNLTYQQAQQVYSNYKKQKGMQ